MSFYHFPENKCATCVEIATARAHLITTILHKAQKLNNCQTTLMHIATYKWKSCVLERQAELMVVAGDRLV